MVVVVVVVVVVAAVVVVAGGVGGGGGGLIYRTRVCATTHACRSKNFTAELIASGGAASFDIVYDTVGGPEYWHMSQPLLKRGGAYVTIVGDKGEKKSLLGLALWKSTTILRSLTSGFTYVHYTAAPSGATLDAVRALVDAGKIRAVVDSTHCLTTVGVREAYGVLMRGRAVGKVVVSTSASCGARSM